MKTTLEVPDDLYALVKARAALEGRTLRAVMEELLKEWVAPRAQARTAAQRHGGTDEERRGEEDDKGPRRTKEDEGKEKRRTKKEERKREAGVVAEEAGESYGGTKEGKRKRGAGSETAEKVYPWDVLRLKWEREHNPNAPIDQIAGTLKGSGPKLDMAQAREAYMRDIADEWRRREAKGASGRGDAGGAGNAEGNGSRET